MNAEIQTAADRAESLCEALDLTEDAITYAMALADRAERDHPINRTPRVVAAGSVYLAALMTNEKQTQEAVAEQGDVAVVSVRDAYLEIADHEGLNNHVEPTDDEPGPDDNTIFIDHFVDRVVIRSDCPVEPCASDSWIKIRAVAVAFLAGVPGLYIMSEGFDTTGWLIAVASMLIAIKIMSTRLNQRIEYGHTCGRSDNSGKPE